MSSLTITICTADRPASLGNLLAALASAEPGRWSRDVVIADNGRDPTTAEVIARHDSDALPMRRVVAPPYNIARARNAALRAATGDLVVWIDDDQLVGPTFFSDLERAWSHRPAWSDGVRLRFVPRFEDGDTPLLTQAWFTPPIQPEGAPVTRATFATCGFLVPRARSLAVPRTAGADDGPFDPWFGTRGGEDTDFFMRATAMGMRFSMTSLVQVIESVPRDRARLPYMARAAFRIGFTDAVLSRRERSWLRLTTEAAIRVAIEVGLAPLALGDGNALKSHALSVCRQAGKLWALAGRDFQHYARRPR